MYKKRNDSLSVTFKDMKYIYVQDGGLFCPFSNHDSPAAYFLEPNSQTTCTCDLIIGIKAHFRRSE